MRRNAIFKGRLARTDSGGRGCGQGRGAGPHGTPPPARTPALRDEMTCGERGSSCPRWSPPPERRERAVVQVATGRPCCPTPHEVHVTRGHSGAAGLRAGHRSTQTTPNMQPPQCQVLPTLLSPPWQPRGCEPQQLLLGTGTLLTPAQVCPAPSVRRCPLRQGRAQDRGEEGLGGATRGPWPWASSTSGPLDRMPGRGARPAARAAWPGTGTREGRVAAGDHRGTGVAEARTDAAVTRPASRPGAGGDPSGVKAAAPGLSPGPAASTGPRAQTHLVAEARLANEPPKVRLHGGHLVFLRRADIAH